MKKEKLKKFFKILGILFGILLILIVGFCSYIYFWNKERIETGNVLSQKVKNFESDASNEYAEYSVQLNKSGDFENGFKYLNKAVELDPELYLGYRGWIRLRKIRDYDNALIDFARLDRLTPNVVNAPWGEDIDFLRGECYFGKKNYKKAIQMFNRSVQNQKEDWADIHSFVYLGLCEYKLGKYEKSITEFQRALNQSKTTPESYFGMAKAYEKLGEIDKAKENISNAEENILSKRDDVYNEFLNEIYLSEILEFKQTLEE